MTLKDFVNTVLDYAEQFIKAGDHERYQKCIKLIADAMYETWEENTIEIVDK
jgi:hypothetical protein